MHGGRARCGNGGGRVSPSGSLVGDRSAACCARPACHSAECCAGLPTSTGRPREWARPELSADEPSKGATTSESDERRVLGAAELAANKRQPIRPTSLFGVPNRELAAERELTLESESDDKMGPRSAQQPVSLGPSFASELRQAQQQQQASQPNQLNQVGFQQQQQQQQSMNTTTSTNSAQTAISLSAGSNASTGSQQNQQASQRQSASSARASAGELSAADPQNPYPLYAPVTFFYLSQTVRPRSWCLAIVSNKYPLHSAHKPAAPPTPSKPPPPVSSGRRPQVSGPNRCVGVVFGGGKLMMVGRRPSQRWLAAAGSQVKRGACKFVVLSGVGGLRCRRGGHLSAPLPPTAIGGQEAAAPAAEAKSPARHNGASERNIDMFLPLPRLSPVARRPSMRHNGTTPARAAQSGARKSCASALDTS